MSLSSHLSQLKLKHEAIARQIETEQKHPGSDRAVIATLKKRKLAVKDEIERLNHH